MTDDPLPYRLDASALLSPDQHQEQQAMAELTREAVRAIHETQEQLLKQWVAGGLPLEWVEPKWEFGEVTEGGKLPVRVWLELVESDDRFDLSF